MNKIGSIVKGKLEGTKRSASPASSNDCIAIIFNEHVENDNNDTNKDKNDNNNYNNNNNNNNNSDNNDMKKKGKTSIYDLKIYRHIFAFICKVFFQTQNNHDESKIGIMRDL